MTRCLSAWPWLAALLLCLAFGFAPSGALAAGQNGVCLHCHGAQPNLAPEELRLDRDAANTHASLKCQACHAGKDAVPHRSQPRTACLSCHVRHGESVAHDVHERVACEACHLGGDGKAVLKDGGVVFVAGGEGALKLHDMKPGSDGASCARCHFAGNEVGAPAAALPPKGVLCAACHAATATAEDLPTRAGLFIFLAGFIILACSWIFGMNLGKGEALAMPEANHGPRDPLGRRLWNFFLDAFLQRRLWREDREAWGIHAMIFFPFVFRSIWGLAALGGSLAFPAAEWPWLMLARDWAPSALLFDLSGLVLLAGLALAWRRWRQIDSAGGPVKHRDRPALILIFATTLAGFLLEGMRIAIAHAPEGSSWAFAGRFLSCFIGSGSLVQSAYGFVWYLHACLTAATACYIPFSQLRHMFTAPASLLADCLGRRR